MADGAEKNNRRIEFISGEERYLADRSGSVDRYTGLDFQSLLQPADSAGNLGNRSKHDYPGLSGLALPKLNSPFRFADCRLSQYVGLC